MLCLLDILEKIAQIITVVAIFIALKEYRYRRKRDLVLATAEQIAFFREKVIPKTNELISHVRKITPDYVFNRIRLVPPDLNTIRRDNFDFGKKQADLLKNEETFFLYIDLLNLLEEISWRIIHSETSKHEALNSVKHLFVAAVEMSAVVLLMQREILTGESSFSGTLKLYDLWKDSVDRLTPQERLNNLSKRF